MDERLRQGLERVQRFLQSRRGKIISATFLALIGLFILFDFMIMPIYTRQGTQRLVPDLVRSSAARAQIAADSAGFVLVVAQGKVSNRVPAGTILEQHPTPGTLAKPGRKIRVIPALPAAPDVAPDLTGLDVRDAQLRCKNVGLVCGITEVRYRFSSRVAKGGVIEQDPPAGKPVRQGSSVKLVVSMGPEPAHYFVPTLVDQSLHDVRSVLREAGLRLGKIERRETAEYPAGTIIGQSVRAGEQVESGTVVDVVVAVAPQTTDSTGTSRPDDKQPY
jgi:serine/threonine-protein kinase